MISSILSPVFMGHGVTSWPVSFLIRPLTYESAQAFSNTHQYREEDQHSSDCVEAGNEYFNGRCLLDPQLHRGEEHRHSHQQHEREARYFAQWTSIPPAAFFCPVVVFSCSGVML